MNLTWRKRIAIWRNRLYLYPPPDAMPHTGLFWVATGMVTLLALLFAGYFIFYLTGRHDAYITSAEDLGIMDQAIWNTLHGHLLQQTICNATSDTNCYAYNGISRFAIHFEPILFPVSLLYLLWPSPKTLLVIQSLVVASGAFPAFWLARLRLRNELAAVVIALLYLLYPAQQQATVYDFHAVTFTAALLLFTLYFLYTRRTAWLFAFAILSMACKEEIPLVILIFGLWSILFQQRWRSGLTLVLLALAWIGLGLLVIHLFSPSGHSLLASRYSALGNSPLAIAKSLLLHPVGILRVYVFEPFHLLYLRILLSPVAYLPLLAPWVFILAVPSLAINLLSSEPNMHSGFFQYNAEIVPVLIFSTIEAIVLILWLAQWCLDRFLSIRNGKDERSDIPSVSSGRASLYHASTSLDHALRDHAPTSLTRAHSNRGRMFRWVHLALLCGLLVLMLYSMERADVVRGAMPFSAVPVDGFQGATQFSPSFQWPRSTAHDELAQHFIAMIPPDASVSAQSHLAPHVSERTNIYLFPYADDRADYIFLDVTGNTYPLLSFDYIHEVKKVLLGGDYGIAAAQDGYLLLKRGLPAPGISPYSPDNSSSDVSSLLPQLPPAFCSFIYTPSGQVQNPLQVSYSGSTALQLVGENVLAAHVFSLSNSSMQLTTYWRLEAPTITPLSLLVIITDKNGVDHFATTDFPATAWCPTNSWQSGSVISVISDLFLLREIPNGLAHISLALLPMPHPFSTIMDEQSWYTIQVMHTPTTMVATHAAKALQLATISVVP